MQKHWAKAVRNIKFVERNSDPWNDHKEFRGGRFHLQSIYFFFQPLAGGEGSILPPTYTYTCAIEHERAAVAAQSKMSVRCQDCSWVSERPGGWEACL
jgi:hypothetical protein